MLKRKKNVRGTVCVRVQTLEETHWNADQIKHFIYMHDVHGKQKEYDFFLSLCVYIGNLSLSFSLISKY